MNRTEAKIIIICQKPRRPRYIWLCFNWYGDSSNYTYNYIARKCSDLEALGYLRKRKIGRAVYYQATQEAINKAIAFANRENEKKMMITTTIKEGIRKVTEFV